MRISISRVIAVACFSTAAPSVLYAAGSSGGPTVVDSVGQVVGTYLTMPYTSGNFSNVPTGFELVRGTFGSVKFTVAIDPVAGFADRNSRLWYRSTDCSGTPYLLKSAASSTVLGELSMVSAGVIYVPSKVLQNHHFFSAKSAQDGCVPDDGSNLYFYAAFPAVASIPISTLGFTPPFSVQ